MTLSRRDQKQRQRDAAFARRAAIVAGDAGKQASNRFLDILPKLGVSTISLYWPLGSELDTGPLLRALHDLGITCALPVVEKKNHPLSFRRWTPETVLEPGAFKVLVPVKTADYLIPDLVITPMLAFDAAGYRLGYGGGFYDRTLEKLKRGGNCTAVGFAYAMQEVAEVVTDRYDHRLDWVVTDQYVRKIV
ncbi:5-formyltetrahydrofolate cyclo-ligase [Sneathiella sp.]|uniref:5-formyltetrahydrofolate cyclo-ligase n=1 Tax=Sneathiella sp. TaxID=1964365 RepID=UPI00262E7019|nr:5-formyltetrahydrofolate cyclo-ligase [Sneathiella sp.]MDF2368123.1 5-formyltetrahydrofolate cyclo-ligase [Sneathiella sp.]